MAVLVCSCSVDLARVEIAALAFWRASFLPGLGCIAGRHRPRARRSVGTSVGGTKLQSDDVAFDCGAIAIRGIRKRKDDSETKNSKLQAPSSRETSRSKLQN